MMLAALDQGPPDAERGFSTFPRDLSVSFPFELEKDRRVFSLSILLTSLCSRLCPIFAWDQGTLFNSSMNSPKICSSFLCTLVFFFFKEAGFGHRRTMSA